MFKRQTGVGKMKTERIGKTSRRTNHANPAGWETNRTCFRLVSTRTRRRLRCTLRQVSRLRRRSLSDRQSQTSTTRAKLCVDQHVDPVEALAVLAEFLKFVLARIDRQERNLVVTVIEQDAAEFRCLCERAELAIRADSSTARDLGVVHDDQPQ